MDVRVIPFDGKSLIYRPLLHMAFIGNQAMGKLALRCARGNHGRIVAADGEALQFLDRIGFLKPDPGPPAAPDVTYKPKTAVLLMTNRCNLRCTYCYAAAGEKPAADMPAELAAQAVDIVAANAAEAGAPSFDLTFHGGGEPTQHWEVLASTIRRARSKKPPCRIVLSSNGVWSAKQRAFLLQNVDGLSLSFDGIREVQDGQRPTAGGGNSFAAVMKTIEDMDRQNFPYSIRMTWTAAYADRFAESVRFFCTYTRCRKFQVEPAFRPGRGGWVHPERNEADLFISTFKEAADAAEEHGAELMYAGARLWLTVCSFCTAAESALVVRPDGRLVACYEITDSRHPLADIFTIGRLGPAGPVMDRSAVKRLATMRQERLSLCRDCFCVWHCAGDCSSRCFSSEGDGHLHFEQRCRINRELSTEMLLRFIRQSDGVWFGKVPHMEPKRMRPESLCRDCKTRNSGRCVEARPDPALRPAPA